MSDLGETGSAIWLVLHSYGRLRQLDPQNPLLRYIQPMEDGDGLRILKEHSKDFWQKYGDGYQGYLAPTLGAYAVEMENEIEKIKHRVAST